MNNRKNIRLWVNQNLAFGKNIVLNSDQSHYLSNVMRCSNGEMITCFNASDGEFVCQISKINKSATTLVVNEQTRTPGKEGDIWLIFTPLKKDKTDFVIEKAVELGVARIIPVITSRTNSHNIKIERYSAQAIEAAEQCGRLSVPEINQPIELDNLLSSWDKNRILYFADERRIGKSAAESFRINSSTQSAVLIGPEGGFSDDEAALISKQRFVQNIKLGPRVLRAETAALAALTIWQATAGDW